MPSKLLNIMAVARPVVVTATPGSDLAEEVRRSDGGVVAEPDDAARLAEALRELCADRSAPGPPGRQRPGARDAAFRPRHRPPALRAPGPGCDPGARAAATG